MTKIKIFFFSLTVFHFELVFWDAERVHRRLLPRRQILHSSHSFCCLYPAEIDLNFFLFLNTNMLKLGVRIHDNYSSDILCVFCFLNCTWSVGLLQKASSTSFWLLLRIGSLWFSNCQTKSYFKTIIFFVNVMFSPSRLVYLQNRSGEAPSSLSLLSCK